MHRHVAGRHRTHLNEKKVKTGGRDRGVGRNGAQIKSHQPPPQIICRFIRSAREHKNALAVTESTVGALIKAVVLGCRKGNRVSQGHAAHDCAKQKAQQRLSDE